MSLKGTNVGVFFVAVLAIGGFLSGCSRSTDNAAKAPANPNKAPEEPKLELPPELQPVDRDKDYVDILLGALNSDEAKKAGALTYGKSAKYKGEVLRCTNTNSSAGGNLADGKGLYIGLASGSLYTGNDPAIQAVDLIKEFRADKAAAEKKYVGKTIIVEGVVGPQGHYSVILKGWKD